jgi:hypothetical protein
MTAEVSRPQFTTSVEAAEEAKENRSKFFGDNVRTVEGRTAPTGLIKTTPAPRPVQPAPTRLAYKDTAPLTDNQPEVFALKDRGDEALKKAQAKDAADRGWRYKFEQEGGHIK